LNKVVTKVWDDEKGKRAKIKHIEMGTRYYFDFVIIILEKKLKKRMKKLYIVSLPSIIN